jgi:hypothetical protein
MAGKKKEKCELSSGKPWGGRREKSGFPAKWSSKTKLVRIPERLESAVMEYARRLDREEIEPTLDNSPDAVKNSAITEDLRQKEQTLRAIESILERWHNEATQHKQTSPRWIKVSELIRELFTELRSPWL